MATINTSTQDYINTMIYMATGTRATTSHMIEMNRELDITDLYIVYNKVKDISPKWISFAEKLHLKKSTINKIRYKHPKDSDPCMIEALCHWLKQDYDFSSYGVPCWRLICVAVSEGGCDIPLAEEIALSTRDFKLVNRLYELQVDFSEVLFATKKSFEQQKSLSSSDIVDYLKSYINEFLDQRAKTSNIAEKVVKELQNFKTISDLFNILQYNYLSWFNYKIIIKLVDELLGNDKLKDNWSGYKKKVDHYVSENCIDVQCLKFTAAGTRITIAKASSENYSTSATITMHGQVCNRELDISDLTIVYDTVKGICANWITFALSLHLNQNTIDIIKANCDRVENCMREALTSWLEKGYDYDRYGVPCWMLIYIAVKKGGCNPALAKKIAHDHPLTKRNDQSNLQFHFSDILHKTKTSIKQELLPDIRDYLESHIIVLIGPQRAMRLGVAAAVIKELRNIETISDLFNILQLKYLSWFNYKLVIKLVSKFLSNKTELKGGWSCYEKELNDYFDLLIKNSEDSQINYLPSVIAQVDCEDYHFFYCRASLYFSYEYGLDYAPKSIDVENEVAQSTKEEIILHKYCQDKTERSTTSRCVSGKKLEVSISEQMVPGMQKENNLVLHNEILIVSGKKLEVSISEQMVPGMQKENNVVLHNEILINGFKECILLKNEQKTIKFEISLTKMKDIILHETIPCNLFLIAFMGLPFSRKSTLVHNFLKEATYTIPNGLDPLSAIEYNQRGISVYNTTLLQHNSDKYLWFTLAKELKEAHPCSSAILSMSFFHNYSLNIVFNGDTNHVFHDKILDAHFNAVCKSVKQRDLIQCSYELQRILSSRMVDVNIIDDGTNTGVTKFFNCIFNHLSYNLGFVCLSIDDVLNDVPDPSHKTANIAAINTRVLLIIRDALRMHSSAAPFFFIIICSEEDIESDRKIAKDMLLREITSINRRLDHKVTALVLDPCSLKNMEELRNVLDEEVTKQCISRKDIKLSWLFLHSALHSSLKDIVISYEKLKDIAEKLGIKGMEVKEFLEMFSKFMSILYFPSFKPLQNVIILRPVEFINTLSLLFRIPDGKTNFNGIYAMEDINKILPNKKLANVMIDVLCSFGLAMKMTSDKIVQVDKSSQTSAIFVPLANNGHILERSTTTNTSLFIVYESRLNLCDCQCFFASQLLAHGQGPGIKKSSLQVGLEYQNIFKVFFQTTQHQDYTFFFIFHDKYIEVACARLRSDWELNIFEYILNCCSEALSKITNTIKYFSYKLALKCLTPSSIQTDDLVNSAKKVFEFFPQSKSPWCYQCKSSTSPQRNKWKELIEKNKDKEEQKVHVHKLLEWAQKIGPYITSRHKLNNFAQKLSVTINYPSHYLLFEFPSWQQVFMVFSILDKRNEATREKIEAAVLYLKLPKEILD